MMRFQSALRPLVWSLIVIILLGLGSCALATDHRQQDLDRSQVTIWPNWDMVLDDVLEHELWPLVSFADVFFPYHNPWHLPQMEHHHSCHRCKMKNSVTNQRRRPCNGQTHSGEDKSHTETPNSEYTKIEDETIRNKQGRNVEIEHLQKLYQDTIQRSNLIQTRIEDLQTNTNTLRNGLSNQKIPITNTHIEEIALPVKSYSKNSVDENIPDRPFLFEESNAVNNQDRGSIYSDEQSTVGANLNEKAKVAERRQRIDDTGQIDHARLVNRGIEKNKSNNDRNSRKDLFREKQKSSGDQFLIIPLNGFLPRDLKISYHGNNNIRVYGSRTCKLEEGCVAKEMDISYRLPSRFNKDTFSARIHGDNIILKENSKDTDPDDSIQSIYNSAHLHKEAIVGDDGDDLWEKGQQTGENNINKRTENLRTEETQNQIFHKHDETSDVWVDGVSIETED